MRRDATKTNVPSGISTNAYMYPQVQRWIRAKGNVGEGKIQSSFDWETSQISRTLEPALIISLPILSDQKLDEFRTASTRTMGSDRNGFYA